MWNSWVEVSTLDAQEMGIVTGDRLRLTSPNGAIEVGAVVLPSVRPGVVCVPFGGGHRSFGRYAEGRGVNPLELIGDLKVEGTHASAWAATRVHIERLGAGQLALFGRGLRQVEDLPPRR